MAEEKTNLPFGLCEQDCSLLKSFHAIIKSLRNLTICNIEFYQRGRSSIHARFYATSCILLERSQVLEPLLTTLIPTLKGFDFSDKVQANGYRTFISITHRCCLHLVQLCRHVNVNKSSLLFRSSHYLKELEDYVETFGQLIACLGYLNQLMSYTDPGELFLPEDQPLADDLLLEVEMLNTDCFYGRCLGFMFCESIQKVLPGILVAMATFSECYEEDSQVMQLATSIFNSGKYLVDQDLRAKQVVDITRTADIKFCKAFWSIPESPLLSQLRSFTFPHVEVSEVISLPPENFELPLEGSTDGTTVTITPPCAHTGPADVKVRLISQCLREGMNITRKRFQPKTGSAKPESSPKSSALLFHCHGGGFVAQSSQSHENYLRMWACKLKVPILSVDYALSPELPFPRALEECFYAYAWALKNPEKLGWTGEYVCFAGDSAGGNLAVSTALRAVSYEIRVPDGVVAAYTPFLVQYTPSPSRLLSMIDPLLPVGILTRCLAAYAGIADEFSSALAKPIFCNPGNYESWEMVKEDEVHQDEPTLPNSHLNYCQTKKEHREEKNATESPENLSEIISSLPQCDSLENLDDDNFVVCDIEDFNADKEKYSGNIIGSLTENENKGVASDENTNTNCNNSVAEDVNTLSTGNGASSEEFSDVCRAKVPKMDFESSRVNVYDTSNSKTILSLNTANSMNAKDSVTVSSMKNGSFTDTVTINSTNRHDNVTVNSTDRQGSVTVNSTDRQDSVTVTSIKKDVTDGATINSMKGKEGVNSMEVQDSITVEEVDEKNKVEDMIRQIDSNVVIQVDSKQPEDEVIEDSVSMYAVCQELVDATNTLSSSEYSSCRNSLDVMSASCHSLEDVVELNMDETCEQSNMNVLPTEKGSLSLYDVSKDGVNHTDAKKTEGCLKQLSISDTSDSGIHGDTDGDTHSDTIATVHKHSTSGLHKSVSDSHIHVQYTDTKMRTFTDPSQGSPKHEVPKSRTFSHDTPGQYHLGLSNLSPAKARSPPVSPTLPAGKRTLMPKRYSVQRKIAQSPIQLFKHLPIVKNLYMSPLLAPDEFLKGLPKVYLMACHFDPLLDDSIAFAKKLDSLGCPVDLHVFDNLPHGFLCFADASLECKKAALYCMETIGKVLHIEPSK